MLGCGERICSVRREGEGRLLRDACKSIGSAWVVGACVVGSVVGGSMEDGEKEVAEGVFGV